MAQTRGEVQGGSREGRVGTVVVPVVLLENIRNVMDDYRGGDLNELRQERLKRDATAICNAINSIIKG